MQDISDISVSTVAADGLAVLGLVLGTGTTISTFLTKYDTHIQGRHLNGCNSPPKRGCEAWFTRMFQEFFFTQLVVLERL